MIKINYDPVEDKVDGDILYADVINTFNVSHINLTDFCNEIVDTFDIWPSDSELINYIKGVG